MQDKQIKEPKQPFQYIFWASLSQMFYNLTHAQWIEQLQNFLDRTASQYMVDDLKQFLK